MGMRIARAQILPAALLLTGCAALSSQTGTYEDILAVGATYPAGKLPITRINRLFGRDPDAQMEVVVGHRETRTETGEITHESIQIAYPDDHRCNLDFSDAPERFNEFTECLARSPGATFGVIVGEVVSDDVTLHTILGFHIHPREEEQGCAAAGGDHRSASRRGTADLRRLSGSVATSARGRASRPVLSSARGPVGGRGGRAPRQPAV